MTKYLAMLFFSQQAAIGAIAPYLQIILRNKGYSHSFVGFFLAVCQICSSIALIIASEIADTTGKTKRIMFLSVFVGLILFIPAIISSSFTVTIISMLVAYCFFFCLPTMVDGISCKVLEGNTKKYGFVRAMGTFGYMLVLIVFGILNFPDSSSNASILSAIAPVLLILCIMVISLPKTINEPLREHVKNTNVFLKIKGMFSMESFDRPLKMMFGIVAITRIAKAIIDKLLPAYMTEVLQVGSRFTLLIAIGAAFEIGMMIFGGRLLQKGRITTWQMIFSSTIGLALRLLIYCFTTSIWAFAIAQTLHAFTYGAIHVGVTKYIVEHVEHNHIGFAMGFYWGACTNIPEMLGAFVGGFIIDSFGYDVLFLSYSAFPIIAGVLMLVLRRQLETKR